MADLKANRSKSPDFEISVEVWNGEKYTLWVNGKTTVLDLKQKILEQSGNPLDSMRVMYEAKELSDYIGNTRNPTLLSAYGIHEGYTIHVVLSGSTESPTAWPEPSSLADPNIWGGSGVSRPGPTESTRNWLSPPPEPSAQKSHEFWEEKATNYDFDEDLYIVDPQAHFELLKKLERDIFERSEYRAANLAYDVTDRIYMHSPDEAVLRRAGLSDPLRADILDTISKQQASRGMISSPVEKGHLIKSYSIVLKAAQSLAQMSRLQFCTESISILVNHTGTNIVEIKPIPTNMIEGIETALELAIKRLFSDLEDSSIVTILTDLVLAPCSSFLRHLGLDIGSPSRTGSSKVLLTFIRKTILLIDNALVSYVRSHGSGFDSDHFGREITDMSVSHGEDSFAFRCYWARLACLDAFLGKRKVWVFCLFNNNLDELPHAQWPSSEPVSVLTRMRDFADIWGPVYTVASKLGLVKNYAVSNGVICRVAQNKQSAALHATRCHYISRLEFTRRSASRILFGDREDDLSTSNDDLLLIGAGLHENRRCQYGLSDLTYETQSEVRFLGTRESVWRTDSRGIALVLSKYLGITVSGTQKFIPQTTLKQHILHKWTTNPSRANPGILDQLLGVEISHCTGNARRISLRELLITKPIWSILERQSPNWTETQWGSDFAAAISSDNREDAFRVWKDHAAHRAEIGDLVCCMLELLDSTGLDESGQFHSALFNGNKDLAIRVPTKLNDWSIALKDTHLTGAYVITNEICLECEVPDHSTSTCTSGQGYTVLQTQLATKGQGVQTQRDNLTLSPFHTPIVQVDCGSADILVFTPCSVFSSQTLMRRWFGRNLACIELLNRTASGSTGNTVFLRASKRSSHGRGEANSLSQRPVLAWDRPSTTPEAERNPQQASMIPAPLASNNYLVSVQSDPLESHNSVYASSASSVSPQPYTADAEIGDLLPSDIYGQDIYDFGSSKTGIEGLLPFPKHQKIESDSLGSGLVDLAPSVDTNTVLATNANQQADEHPDDSWRRSRRRSRP
ncbi:MAG: hypothetical protein Q9172_007779 [Xanthocarpia lactea]